MQAGHVGRHVRIAYAKEPTDLAPLRVELFTGPGVEHVGEPGVEGQHGVEVGQVHPGIGALLERAVVLPFEPDAPDGLVHLAQPLCLFDGALSSEQLHLQREHGAVEPPPGVGLEVREVPHPCPHHGVHDL